MLCCDASCCSYQVCILIVALLQFSVMVLAFRFKPFIAIIGSKASNLASKSIKLITVIDYSFARNFQFLFLNRSVHLMTYLFLFCEMELLEVPYLLHQFYFNFGVYFLWNSYLVVLLVILILEYFVLKLFLIISVFVHFHSN